MKIKSKYSYLKKILNNNIEIGYVAKLFNTALTHKSPPSWGEKMSEKYYKDKLGKKDRHLAVDVANITLEAEIS